MRPGWPRPLPPKACSQISSLDIHSGRRNLKMKYSVKRNVIKRYKNEKIIFLLEACTPLTDLENQSKLEILLICDFLIPRLFFPPLKKKLYIAMPATCCCNSY